MSKKDKHQKKKNICKREKKKTINYLVQSLETIKIAKSKGLRNVEILAF